MDNINATNLIKFSSHDYFKHSLALLKADKTDEALQLLDAAIVFSNNSPFYIFQKIRVLFNIGTYKDCSKFIITQLEYLYNNSSLYLFCRTVDYLQLMNYYSEDDLEAILKYNHIPYCLANIYKDLLYVYRPDFSSLANRALLKGNYTLCIEYCKLYLRFYAISYEIIDVMSYAYHMLGELNNAYTTLFSHSNLFENIPQFHTQLGYILMELKDYKSAIKHLSRACDLEPDNIQHLSDLAECYGLTKNLELSSGAYLKCIDNEYDNTQIYFNLSHLYKKANKGRLSKHYLKLAKLELDKYYANTERVF